MDTIYLIECVYLSVYLPLPNIGDFTPSAAEHWLLHTLCKDPDNRFKHLARSSQATASAVLSDTGSDEKWKMANGNGKCKWTMENGKRTIDNANGKLKMENGKLKM